MLRFVLLIAAVLAVAAAMPQGLLGAWPWAHAARSYAVPAPYSYHNNPLVYTSVEPVEAHGYHIAY